VRYLWDPHPTLKHSNRSARVPLPSVRVRGVLNRQSPRLPLQACLSPTRWSCSTSKAQGVAKTRQRTPPEPAGQVRHQTLQLRVLVAQLPQFAQLLQSQARILLLPEIETLLADAMLAAASTTVSPDSASRNTRRISYSLCPRFPISKLSSLVSENHKKALISQLQSGLVFGFWVNVEGEKAGNFTAHFQPWALQSSRPQLYV
jgi:hypothetical protein